MSTTSKPSRKSTTGKASITKPAKPYPDYPLYAHAVGQWAKKVYGRVYYFGTWADPEAAVKKWLRVRDHLLAGVAPPPVEDESTVVTVKVAFNLFLRAKKDLVDSGELSGRTHYDYKATLQRVAKCWGLTRPYNSLGIEDFARLRRHLAIGRGPIALGHEIQRTRCALNWIARNIEGAPKLVMGDAFARPSKRVIRKARNASEARLLEAREIRRLIKAAPAGLRAMILLGINCAMGNSDCATLPLSNVDLRRGWIDHPRPKTEVKRRCPLWPQTVEAIRAWLNVRPKPADAGYNGLVFLTVRGKPWQTDGPYSPISAEFAKLAKSLGIHRERVGVYTLRAMFRTVADEVLDRPAVDLIMGHDDASQAANYRRYIDDKRLVKISDHVHRWLYRISPAQRDQRCPRH